eukprot:6663833-Prymnesium_polylepis.1
MLNLFYAEPRTRTEIAMRLDAYRGGEKGPQGSGTKTVSIRVAWTHRGVERYAGVFPCFTCFKVRLGPVWRALCGSGVLPEATL